MVETSTRNFDIEEAHEQTAQRLRDLIQTAGITLKHLDSFSPSRQRHVPEIDYQFLQFLVP